MKVSSHTQTTGVSSDHIPDVSTTRANQHLEGALLCDPSARLPQTRIKIANAVFVKLHAHRLCLARLQEHLAKGLQLLVWARETALDVAHVGLHDLVSRDEACVCHRHAESDVARFREDGARERGLAVREGRVCQAVAERE